MNVLVEGQCVVVRFELPRRFDQRREKQPEATEAEALRQAQLELLKSREWAHPYYWGAFVCLGNPGPLPPG